MKVIGLLDTKEQADEVKQIVKISIVGFRCRMIGQIEHKELKTAECD